MTFVLRFHLFFWIGLITGFADITGTVELTGSPKSPDTTFYAKAYGCGESPLRKTENWKLGPKGELAEVVVWIVAPSFGPMTGALPVPKVNQIGCRYEPHVQVTLPSLGINFVNSDPAPHNVHVKETEGVDQPLGADIFNIGEGRQGMESTQTFPHSGLYNVACDVHYWMQGWIYVLPESTRSAFSLTDAAGHFVIKDSGLGTLQDGIYTLCAWHPRFKRVQEQKLTVLKGRAEAKFIFDAAQGY